MLHTFFMRTSKALILSVATNNKVLSSIRYKSRTFPQVISSRSGQELLSNAIVLFGKVLKFCVDNQPIDNQI
jgi:hypothetical protein